VIGTPAWFVLRVAVMVIGEPPAVKVETGETTDAMVVPAATEYITNEGPA
jgi:hypothetical protein